MLSQKHKGGRLEAVRSFRATPSVTDEAIFNYLHSLDTPRSLAVWIMYNNPSCHDELAQLDIEPSNYSDAYAFRSDYAASLFLSKSTFLKTTFKRDEKAVAKFLQYEELCRVTNFRFQNPSLDPLNNGSNVWLLNATKRKIAEVLGDYSGDEFVNEAGWGPGVSTLLKGEEVSAYNKFRSGTGITHDLYSLVREWFPLAYPAWWDHLSAQGHEVDPFTKQIGNAIVTVPKNSKTDRVIAIEPDLNLWFQKSCGSMIRKRLRRVGIDLNSQETNQLLAKRGSVKGAKLATIDFSSASDSISREVVRELVPPRWFQLMDVCRSKIGKRGDSIIRWEKFSSMGNGFTFELESLIFYAAAFAVQEFLELKSQISVFGDDVIIHSDAFDLYTSYCEFLGFRINKDKSFGTGPFRESCGSHFFDGLDCKPIFLKDRIQNVEGFYKLANNVRNLAHRWGSYSSCDDRFLACWRHLFQGVPELLQLTVPRTAGDTGFQVNFDEACPTRARSGIEGFYYCALTSPGITRSSDHRAMEITRLWQAEGFRDFGSGNRLKGRALALFFADINQFSQGAARVVKLKDKAYANDYTLRGRSKRTISRSLVPQWYNLGEWR
jgi:hypothetical protein